MTWFASKIRPEVEKEESRHRFLLATQKVAPEVLETLRDRVLPVYSAYDREDFLYALDEWAKKYNLNCSWVKKYAENTVRRWHKVPTHLKYLRWALELAYFSSEPLTINLNLNFSCSCPGWDPLNEKRKEARKRIENYAIKVLRENLKPDLEAYLNEMEQQSKATGAKTPQLKRARSEDSLLHYKWLALYKIKGQTYEEITAEWQKENDEFDFSTIYRGIRSAAERIELPLNS